MTNRLKHIASGIVFVLMGWTAYSAADDIFVDIPGMPGESQKKAYENLIEARAASGNFSKKNCGDFTIVKFVDAASPPLIAAAVSQHTFSGVEVVFVRAGGDADPFEYLTLRLDEAIVSSLSTQPPEESERQQENVVLSAGSITVEVKRSVTVTINHSMTNANDKRQWLSYFHSIAEICMRSAMRIEQIFQERSQ